MESSVTTTTAIDAERARGNLDDRDYQPSRMIVVCRACGCLFAGGPFVCGRCVEVDDVLAERDRLRDALQAVLASAVSNAREHPTMHAAWAAAREVLGTSKGGEL